MPDESDLLLAIYASVTSDDALKRMLELLAKRFACGSAALFYVAKHKIGADITLAYGTLEEPDVIERYKRDFAALDPAPGLLARLPLGEVSSTDAIYTERDFELYSPFLSGFYYPLGLGGALGGPIANQDGQLGGVAVQRPLSRAPFDEADAQAFRAFMPHLIQAVGLRNAFFETASRVQSLEQSCEVIPLGVLTFGRSRTLESANRAPVASWLGGTGSGSTGPATSGPTTARRIAGCASSSTRSPPARVFPCCRCGAVPAFRPTGYASCITLRHRTSFPFCCPNPDETLPRGTKS